MDFCMYNLTMRKTENTDTTTNNDLIPSDELIKKAQEAGVNFGRGEPYNRLRYYTKMGWIPHMKRKGKDVKGHYPEWVINRLKYIEELRKKGVSKENITEEIQKTEKKENIKNTYFTRKNKKLALLIVGISIIGVLILNEMDLIKVGKNRKDLIPLEQGKTAIFP